MPPFILHGIMACHDRVRDADIETKRKVAKVAVCVFGFIVVKKVCVYTYTYIDRKRTRRRKLDQVQTTKGKLLQKLVGLKTPIENRDSLTTLTYEQIRDQYEKESLHALDLLEAYQAKALEVDRTLNCITDVVYDADVTALYLDSLPKEQHGRLHGIPLSVKDCVCMTDYDAYYGCISRCFNPEKSTACVIKALENEGMIPFVRTNMSQRGMTIDCDNPLFGETVNPLDNKRTCGGSSGGEGAVIGAGGSIVGIGSDIGGSIRIPASHCGIYGFKPTTERIGRTNSPKCKYSLYPLSYRVSVGPLSSNLDLLVDVMRVLCSSALFDLDDNIPKLHFDDDGYKCEEPMKIGFYKSFSDNYLSFEPVPAVKRAVEEVKAALERRGHTLVEWEPPRIAAACDLLARSMFVDGGEIDHQFRKEEIILSPGANSLCSLASLHPKMKVILSAVTWLVNPIVSRHLIRTISARTSYDAMALLKMAEDYKKECGKSWNEAGLDGVICPVIPYSAPLVGDTKDLMPGAWYCNLYNFLNYPAGVVPVTRVTEEDVRELRSSYRRIGLAGRKLVRTLETSTGSAVGVQCVAKTWQDEKALRLMREVRDALSS